MIISPELVLLLLLVITVLLAVSIRNQVVQTKALSRLVAQIDIEDDDEHDNVSEGLPALNTGGSVARAKPYRISDAPL